MSKSPCGVRHEDARKNMTCWPPFSRQRNKASGQSLRLQWRTFAADIMAVRLQNSNRRNDVRHYRLDSFVTLLDFAGLSSNLAYITSVFISYIGTDSIGSLIKRYAAKKAGVKMVEINNQRRRSSICWRGRRELITDVKNQKSWLWRHCRPSYLLITPITLANVTLNPKLKSTGAGRYKASFPLVGCHRKQLGLKNLPKSQDAGIAAD